MQILVHSIFSQNSFITLIDGTTHRLMIYRYNLVYCCDINQALCKLISHSKNTTTLIQISLTSFEISYIF